jgi:glutamate-1-semialdehyde 2,1-aminomutase
VLVDLMPHRLGFLWCDPNYLEMLRTWTLENGALLVFDEVITLRLGYGGAQERYSQRPDLTSIAKIIGGGFPVGAVAGRADVMEVFNPALKEIPVPHGGTFNANPITMAAGAAAMSLLTRDQLDHIDKLGSSARRALAEALKIADVQGSITGDGSLFYIHFSRRDFSDYRSTYRSPVDRKRVTRLVDEMLDRGIVLGTTAMGSISTVMSTPEIDALAQAFLASLRAMRRDGVFEADWAG